MYNEAVQLENEGRLEESEELYRQTLSMYQKLAEQSPTGYRLPLARTMRRLALLISRSGRKEEAEKMLR